MDICRYIGTAPNQTKATGVWIFIKENLKIKNTVIYNIKDGIEYTVLDKSLRPLHN